LASDKSLTSASAAGAVLSAFLASLCCIGPLVFAMLGIGGAGLLVKFEAYRPYFTGLTAALLAAGFYLTYRKPKAAVVSAVEGPACDCEHPKANRLGRAMLWVAAAVVVAFWSFPYIAARLWG
jgi:mercuric ion transport protein